MNGTIRSRAGLARLLGELEAEVRKVGGEVLAELARLEDALAQNGAKNPEVAVALEVVKGRLRELCELNFGSDLDEG